MVEFHNSFANLSVLEHIPTAGRRDPVAYLRAATPMPLHAEELIDRSVTEVALEGLKLVDYMYSSGLKTTLGNWLGVINYKWQKRSRTGNPQFGMYPDFTVQREDAKPDLDLDSLPVYCVSQRFTIHPRLMAEWEEAVSRGYIDQTLDTTMVQDAITNLNRAIELATIEGPENQDGVPFQVNGQTVPGLVDGAIIQTHTTWTTKTGEQIKDALFAQIDKAQVNHHYGPYVLAVGTKYGRRINDDYVTGVANQGYSTRERLLEDELISDIITVDMLPQDTTLLIEPKKTNLDLVVGQLPTWFSWTEGPVAMPIRNYMAIACVFLRVREDMDGQNGVVVGSLA
jgi:hypothetical protein